MFTMRFDSVLKLSCNILFRYLIRIKNSIYTLQRTFCLVSHKISDVALPCTAPWSRVRLVGVCVPPPSQKHAYCLTPSLPEIRLYPDSDRDEVTEK